jgi:hypothetical protein
MNYDEIYQSRTKAAKKREFSESLNVPLTNFRDFREAFLRPFSSTSGQIPKRLSDSLLCPTLSLLRIYAWRAQKRPQKRFTKKARKNHKNSAIWEKSRFSLLLRVIDRSCRNSSN